MFILVDGPQPQPGQSGGSRRDQAPGAAFWILAILLVAAFAAGGSSRADAPLLFLLRPFAILIAAWGLVTMPRERWSEYRMPVLLLAAVILLTAAHLIPLPPALWRALPGHAMVLALDAVPGMADVWRPLSLVPGATLNALASLSVPAATMLMAMQLAPADRIRILLVLLALILVSALLGVIQAAGVPISVYHSVTAEAGIEATGLFANRNHQAALLALALPAVAVAARVSEEIGIHRRLMRLLAVGGALFVLPLLIVTGSRAGLIVGVIAVFVTLFYGLFRSEWLARMRSGKAMAIRLAVAIVALVTTVAVTVLAGRDVALSRLETATSDLRPRLWASIVPILPDYQPLGSGIGSYVEVYRAREPLELLRETYSNHAHNEYLEIFLTAGVPGMLLLLIATVALALCAWRARRGSDPSTLLARLGCAILLILACASLGDYPVRAPALAAVLALAAIWAFHPLPTNRRD